MAEVIKKKKVKTTNGSKDIYYGVENCKYINTNGQGSQTLAAKLSSTDTNISNIQDTLSNASTGLVKRVGDIEKDFAEFETSFQNGCKTIADKCTANGVTISATAGPEVIGNAIDTIATNEYKKGRTFTSGNFFNRAHLGNIAGNASWTNSSSSTVKVTVFLSAFANDTTMDWDDISITCTKNFVSSNIINQTRDKISDRNSFSLGMVAQYEIPAGATITINIPKTGDDGANVIAILV